MYVQGIIADIFFCLSTLYLADGILITTVKKYNDQPALIGLVGHFNLNISREIKAFNSLNITPIDLRKIKRTHRLLPIRIQEVSPPLQH